MDAQENAGPDAVPVDEPDPHHPPILVNENPLSGTFYSVVEFIQAYGWFLILGVIVLLYIKSKLSPKLEQFKQRMEEKRDKKYDPVVAQSRMEAMDAARRKLQEKFDAQAAQYGEQMKEKEEEKRKQKIEDWDGHLEGKGYRSKYKPKEDTPSTSKPLKKDKKPLRSSDYNPLDGSSGGSSAWRPSARGGGASGGG